MSQTKKPRRTPAQKPVQLKRRDGFNSIDVMQVRTHQGRRKNYDAAPNPMIFRPYKAPEAVVGTPEAAMDWNASAAPQGIDSGWVNSSLMNFIADGMGFFGYPRLAEMSQRPEYRMAAETLSKECTREWIEIKAGGDRGKADKVAELVKEMDRLKARETFRKHVEKDAYFGMSHIFPVIQGAETILNTPMVLGENGFKKGSLKELKVIEPWFTTPQAYNSISPLEENFYQPTMWLVMGKPVDASRLITGVAREVSDMLKPAYNFGGVPLSQVMFAAVNNWLRNRDNSAAFLEQASLIILKANLSQALQGEGVDTLLSRVDAFNEMRTNSGTMVCDKESEEIEAINRTIGGLTEMMNSSLEQLCVYSGQPRVKLLGVSPGGLNANSEGEVRVWYDNVLSYQEHFIAPGLDRVFEMAQLNIWGSIDPDISYEFVPLWQASEQENAEIEKIRAETDAEVR